MFLAQLPVPVEHPANALRAAGVQARPGQQLRQVEIIQNMEFSYMKVEKSKRGKRMLTHTKRFFNGPTTRVL